MARTYHHLTPEQREKWHNLVITLAAGANPRAVALGDQLRLIAHALYQIGELSVTKTELSFAKYRLLVGLFFNEQIDGRCEMNPSEISQQQGTSRNTISALIRDLEGDELIERSLDRHDRRKFNIQLTGAGRDLVREHVSTHLHIIASCFDTLDDEEQETLGHLLTKLSKRVFQTHDDLTAA
jgi:DNA-binding MarR family transcriptional regulator